MTKINKVQKYTENFTLSNNTVIQDRSLSWKARGIFIYLFSLPDNWSFREREIAKHSSNGITALTSGVKELQSHHYLLIKRDMKGHTHWLLSDRPMKTVTKPHHENPDKDNPDMEKPDMENKDELQSTDSYKVLSGQSTHRTRSESVRENEDYGSEYDNIIKYFNSRLPLNRLHRNQRKQLKSSVSSWIHSFSSDDIEKAVDVARDASRKSKIYNPIAYVSRVLDNLKQSDLRAKRRRHHHHQRVLDNDCVLPDEQQKEADKQIKAMVERAKHGKLLRD